MHDGNRQGEGMKMPVRINIMNWNDTHTSFLWIDEANRTFLHPCPLLQKEELNHCCKKHIFFLPHNKWCRDIHFSGQMGSALALAISSNVSTLPLKLWLQVQLASESRTLKKEVNLYYWFYNCISQGYKKHSWRNWNVKYTWCLLLSYCGRNIKDTDRTSQEIASFPLILLHNAKTQQDLLRTNFSRGWGCHSSLTSKPAQ